MNTLHERIEKAVKHRLVVAMAALDSLEDWTADTKAPYGPTVGPWHREVEQAVWSCDDELDGCPEEARGWIAEARHIAANDPACIIRDCTEDLWLLSQHEPDEADVARGLDPECTCGDLVNRQCPQVLSLARRYDIATEATP